MNIKNFLIVFLVAASSITALKAATTDQPYDSTRFGRTDSVQFFERKLATTTTEFNDYRNETRFKRYGSNLFLCGPAISMLASISIGLLSDHFFNGTSAVLFGVGLGSLVIYPAVLKEGLFLAISDGITGYDRKKSNIVFFSWLISLLNGEPTNKGRQIYKSYLKFIKNHNKQNNTTIAPLSLEKFTDEILKLAKDPEKYRFEWRLWLDREDFFKELHGI